MFFSDDLATSYYRSKQQLSNMGQTRALYTLTSTKVLELIKSNTITVEEYASSLLARIQERDNTVKAWEYLGRFTRSRALPLPFSTKCGVDGG